MLPLPKLPTPIGRRGTLKVTDWTDSADHRAMIPPQPLVVASGRTGVRSPFSGQNQSAAAAAASSSS
ncbi:hypothetical protein N7510_009193 [Penicillium lagena]|uniref:uncharacterized protein n=1 Tax=Penicillium lagena TaxID=94218 RepID=UPI0025413E19|nr:uncharacterized protein N7510_009193 [Penicillium lagena]KAJ5606412.1 hypothetical protein N7510_009193 [Penicillium lagena]